MGWSLVPVLWLSFEDKAAESKIQGEAALQSEIAGSHEGSKPETGDIGDRAKCKNQKECAQPFYQMRFNLAFRGQR